MIRKPLISIKRAVGLAFLAVCFLMPYMAFTQETPALMLFDFENDFASQEISLSDAKSKLQAEGKNHVLKVTLGHSQDQPAVKLTMQPRDLSGYVGIAMDIKNLGPTRIGVEAQCYNDNIEINPEPGKFFYKSLVMLEPGETDTLFIFLARHLDSLPPSVSNYLHGMRGLPGGFLHRWDVLDLANITNIKIHKKKADDDYYFTVDNIRAVGKYNLPSENALKTTFFPFVDQFGQYMHGDWPGKTETVEDMLEQKIEEDRDLMLNPGPSDWDKYGGWNSGPLLQATGHFRVEKYQGKWWLVDPDGRLFWSQGIVAIGFSQITPIEGRENYFTQIPPNGDFLRANLLLKYSNIWNSSPRDTAAIVILKRMRSWGINTLCGSDRYLNGQKKVPYTMTLRSGIVNPLPDTLDEETFRTICERSLLRLNITSMANDPWCVGIFIDNELAFSSGNASEEVIETYYKVVREVLNKLAPDKLYLGSRTNLNNVTALASAAKHCDVISINRYEYTVSDFTLPGNIDKPVIIGEFHFGALDRGSLHTGLRSVYNQKQRARVYTNYINQALESPLFIGTHWFQYVDQVCTGRRDGENYQIGFIDICDRPHPEMVAASRKISSYLYSYRLNGIKGTDY